jgi:hypothetical protein
MKKNKKKFLDRLDSIKIGRPQSLLVFETTGFTLYGTFFSAGLSASLTQEAAGKSAALDFEIAVAEVLTQLREQTKKKLPKTALIITPSAASGLLYLPVNPEEPRPKEQMNELVRWEIEPLFARQNGIWFLGALLMGRGYINGKQREEIAAGAGPHVRFGNEACERGFVSREQIDECLSLQEKLVLFDDDLVSNWVPQFSESEEEGMFTWYGVGFGDAMRRQWVKGFRQAGISLRWVYPQIGLASGSIPTGEREWMLVEIRQEQFAVLRGQAGSLSSLRVEPWQDGQIDLDHIAKLCQEELRPDIEDIYLSVSDDFFEEIAAGLGQSLNRAISAVPLSSEKFEHAGIPGQIMASMAGAAAHALGQSAFDVQPRIMAQPPKPPVWKRKELLLPAAVAAVFLVIIGFDASMRYRTWQNGQKLLKLDVEFNQKVLLKNQTEKMAYEVDALQNRLAEKEQLLKKQQAKYSLMKDGIIDRITLVPGLLRAISTAMGDEVLIDTVKEAEDRSGILLKGLTLTDTDGQIFVNRLNIQLKAWNYKVAGVNLNRGKGRVDINGYVLQIKLVPTVEEFEEKG